MSSLTARLMSSNFPAQLEVRSTEGAVARYELASEFYAGSAGKPLSAADRLVARLDDNIAVFEGAAPTGDATGDKIFPVYRAQPSGAFAVPTGRIWVRFAEGVKAEGQQEAMEKLGFSIAESPAWAPQAAWVRASSGKIADALAAASRLKTLPDVELVEPQILTAAARKTEG
jgi:hypothetical protein